MNHPLKTNPLVRAFYMDDTWGVARDPIHNMWQAVDPVHALLCGGQRPPPPAANWGTGPAVAFAQRLQDQTGVPQGVLACAHGGTSMAQWDPVLAGEQGNRCLYGALLRRLRRNGGRVSGMIWYQGCSDANPDAAKVYTEKMCTLVARLRRDCRAPRLPVVAVQIARVTFWGGGEQERAWNSIQEQERLLPRRIRNLAVVPAIDLALDDGIHIGEADQVRLGARLAYAMRVLVEGRKAGLPPIELKRVGMEADSFGRVMVVAEFDHVVGKLVAGSRPAGFTLEGSPAGSQFDIALDGNRALIRTGNPQQPTPGWWLHYGRGTDPYCNITDMADRAVPVFGPVLVGKPRALMTVTRALVSAFQPGAGQLEALAPPSDRQAWGLQPRAFESGFLNLHPEIAARGTGDAVVYYAIPWRCEEPMRLALGLGYDGPIKAWLDGEQVAHDPDGINPCLPGKRRVVRALGAGVHELLVALGTNQGRAWGIMVDLERLDVPARILRTGDRSLYRMPVIEV